MKIWLKGLRGKLLIMVFLPVSVMLVSTIIALNALQEQNENSDLVANKRMPEIITLLRLRINAEAAVRFLWATTGFENSDIRKNKAENSRKKFQAFDKEYNQFISYSHVGKEIKSSMELMYEDWKRVETLATKALTLLLNNTPAMDKEAKSLMEESLIPLYLKQIDSIAKIEKTLQAQVDATVIQAADSSNRTKKTLLVLGLLATLAIFCIGIYIGINLSTSLSKVSQQIKIAGSNVGMAGCHLQTASQSLSSATTESASALEETVTSLEELTSMVKINAENAKQAASISEESNTVATNGEEEVKKLIEAMSEITDSSKKIEEIIHIVDDIAFRTNLLALNAAVEAARAGEQGKGFAVVAEAVRGLAQRSAVAAKEIHTLIQDSIKKTHRGSAIANQNEVFLKKMASSIKQISNLNSEIAAGSKEQSNGLTQIGKAMNGLDTATQSNAASAEEVSASSDSLSAQAEVLQDLVEELSFIVNGKGKTTLARDTSFA